ncbi:MAG: phosphoribosylformylglycinamidine cyclo-ligase [Candidatus Beckwithbacteria bacterium]|nr:phosphoribosylformylglycinamidine cyclo-ligase [Candidatus Beckwithbacteria bacterium]
MKYADIEGLAKKDAFKKGIIGLVKSSGKNLLASKIRLVPESLGEPAALLDFLKEDFYLAFKTDGVGTKSLIAETMAEMARKKKWPKQRIINLYSGLGIDLIASNVNDLICLGATPLALSDEVAVGYYQKFLEVDFVSGLLKGLKKGCEEARITIPCGESPTMTDVIKKNASSITGSAIGIIRPKKKAIFGQNLTAGDAIFGLSSSGIHTNGLSLARKIAEKLPQGYFTAFGRQTAGEELLTPTRIYVRPVLEMIDQLEIHYISHISGSAFRKVSRAKKPFTYVIDNLPQPPKILTALQKWGKVSNKEAYETWNMGVGIILIAPLNQEEKMRTICRKYNVGLVRLGWLERGSKKVIIKEGLWQY